MSILHWFRPPRHLLALFLGTTLSLSAGLAWVGWRSLQQDRAVEVQRVRDRLESSTDLIAAEVRQNLTDIEEQLTRLSVLPAASVDQAAASYSQGLGEEALVVIFADDVVSAFPNQRLLYYPALPAPEETVVPAFAAGEAYEFGARDFGAAIAYFRDLAQTDDERVRAEALVRLARNQRKAGQFDAALATYARLSQLPRVSVGGRPADLVAHRARCALLAERGRRTELGLEARTFGHDLHRGRWPLTRAAYQYFVDETEQWLTASGAPDRGRGGPEPAALSLAAGVDSLWERWQQDRKAPDMLGGRISTTLHERSVFLLWRGTAERLVAVVGGPGFLTHQILDPLRGVLERQEVGVVLADGEGRTVVSDDREGAHGQNVLRTMTDTRLPWTLRVVGADPEASLGQLAARRRMVFAGLGLLALLVVAGSYFSARAMTREIEAARLQSDFVAAVSHEFRTPLTAMRQFSDLLAEGRVAGEEERQQFYGALQRGTRRLTRLVENVLDFGRMEAGSHAFHLEPLAVKEWIERVTLEFQGEVRARGYRIDVEWSGPNEAILRADEAALGRALWNLLDNAVKYSPTDKTISVIGAVNNGSVTIGVRDRGIGVPAAEQRAIFRKFVRGSVPSGHAVKGTGLGLALVDQIVHAHGGKVRVESQVGEGSTFSIILPVERASPRGSRGGAP